MIGYGVNIGDFKRFFFDRARVHNAADAATRKVLSKFGAFVRQRDRTSIKKRDGTSPPGSPPYSHEPHLLRNWILFAYDPLRRSVIIGAARLSGRIGNAPEALEKGGDSEVLVGPPGRRRRVRARVRARPHTLPAFNAELPGLPAMWAGSIR